MKKKLKRTVALAAGLLYMAGGAPAFAGDAEMEQLKKQMQQLMQQNQQLSKRIGEMEKEMRASDPVPQTEATASSPIPEELLRTQVHQALQKEMRKREEEAGMAQKINEYVTMFGLIEGEVVLGDDYEGNSFSEFNVATVELGFDAQVSQWAVGHILAKYEGPDDDGLFIDEANIWLGNYEQFPLLMTAGKFYMPFGNFETNMIQDTMTLEIGEINDYGVAVGFLTSGFYGAVYGYNGMKETSAADTTINGLGAMGGYSYERDDISFDVGICWLGNIADSDGISDYFDEKGLDTINSKVNGFGVHLLGAYGPVSFIGEYVQALDEFYPGAVNPETGEIEGAEIIFKDHGAEPKAWNMELAYTTEFFSKETVFAIGYQGTSEALSLGLPHARYIAAAGMVLFVPGTTLTLEYFHDDDYGIDDGGTDENADVFSAQLAYEF